MTKLFTPLLFFCALLILGGTTVHADSTVFDRVQKSGKIRCGYVTFVPNLVKDPNSGEISGIDHDIMQAVGRLLDKEIEWTAEVGWASTIQGIRSNKFDMVCNGYWMNPMTGQQAFFSRPYYYQPLFLVTRRDDQRFDQNLQAVNSEDVIIAALDHDNGKFIAEADFPKSELLLLPDMSGMGALYESITLNKADVTFADAYTTGSYNENNEDRQVKITQVDNPIRIYPAGFILPHGDAKFKQMIDVALTEVIYSGHVDQILDGYEKYPYSYIRIPRPKFSKDKTR